MERRIAESELVPLRPLEPEVHIVFPGEADAAMHLHGPVSRAGVDIREPRFGQGRGA